MDQATLESGDPCEEASPCKSGTVPQPLALSVSVSNLLRLYQCLLPPSLLSAPSCAPGKAFLGVGGFPGFWGQGKDAWI